MMLLLNLMIMLRSSVGNELDAGCIGPWLVITMCEH